MSDEPIDRVHGIAPDDTPPRSKAKLYLSAVAEDRRLGKRVSPANIVEHLLDDNRFHVLFPSYDGCIIGEDCRACAEEIVAGALAVRALKAALVVAGIRVPAWADE